MKYKVGKSKIQGEGLFTNKQIKENELIGLAHLNDQPTDVVGKYHNHSENPNAYSVKVKNKRFIYALRDLKPGEEITVDYRKQPELEQPESFKKGGEKKFTRDITATNFLNAEHFLSKKPKKNKKKIYSPNAKYYQEGGEPGDKFKERLMKRYPGMTGVYGEEGENLNIVKDPNYDARSYGYGDIEFMAPGLEQVNYENKIDKTLPGYTYINPSPDKYTSVFNPRGANRADIFLDMMHGMRDDQNYEPLLQNFDKAVRDARGSDMQYYYEKDVAKGYKDSQEQWNENYVDGQLRAQLAPGTLGMFSHGRRDYRKERRHDSPEMRAAGEDIRNYIKGKYQKGGTKKPDPLTSFYTVKGSDGVYRKVNGKWEVDWNRSGNFQPLSKGDVAKRTAVLNSQAQPLYDQVYDDLYRTQRQKFTPKPVNKVQPKTSGKIENFDNNVYDEEEIVDGQRVNYVDKNDPSKHYIWWGDRWYVPGKGENGFITDKNEIQKIKNNTRPATQFDLDRLPANQMYSSQDEIEYIGRVGSGEDPYAVSDEIKNREVQQKFENTFEIKPQGEEGWDKKQLSDIQDDSESAKTFLEGWQNSPMYNQMLRNSTEGEISPIGKNFTGYDFYKKNREAERKNINESYENKETDRNKEFQERTGSSGIAGTYFSSPGNDHVEFYPKNENDGRQRDLPVHEYSHATDHAGDFIPKKDIELINSFKTDIKNTRKYINESGESMDAEGLKQLQGNYDYITKPTETRARLNALRYIGKQSGVYDPFTEKMDLEKFLKFNKANSYFSPDDPNYDYNQPLKELRDVYTDEEIIRMLNTISKNDSPQEELNMAARGGEPKRKKGKKPKKVEPYVTSDPEEYAYRKAAYDDSLWLYQNNLRTPALMQPYKSKYSKSDNWLNKLAKWSVDEKVVNRKNLTLTPEQFKKGLKTTWYESGIGRFIAPSGDGKSQQLNNLYTTNESDKYQQSPIHNSNLPKNEPIGYVGNMMRSKNNTGESGQRISQFEPRYKKPVQPVVYKPKEHRYPSSYKPIVNNTQQKLPEGKIMVGKEEMQQLDPKTGTVTTVINPIYEESMLPMQTLHPTHVDNTLRKFIGAPPEITEEDIEDTEDTMYEEDLGVPEPGGHWEDNLSRYIDWDGNSVGYNLPRFRKPGHGGDLIRKGKRRYIHFPSIEKRYDAWIEPDEYQDGGSIYTYSGRPGSYYQKRGNKWYISNSNTGGDYVPIEDPDGKRTAALNKGAVKIMSNPTPSKESKYDKLLPSYNKSPMVASVKGRTEAERKQVDDDIKAQIFIDKLRSDYAAAHKGGPGDPEWEARSSGRTDPMDWLWGTAAVAPLILPEIGYALATNIPGTSISYGTALNTAGGIHGAMSVPDRVQDWKDVSSGKKTWQEATIKTLGTGLELYGGYDAAKKGFTAAKEIYDAGKGSNIFFTLTDEAKAARQLQDAGLLSKSVDPKIFGRYPNLAQTATKRALKDYNTTYRAVRPIAEKMSVDDMVNMAKSGYDINDPMQVAEYMATTVPIGTTRAFRAGLDLHPSQDAIYTGRYKTAEEAAQKLRGYGTHMAEVRPPMNFSEGNLNQWIDEYYTNKLFARSNTEGDDIMALINPEAYQSGSKFKPGVVGFNREYEYWPYIGNRGDKLLESVRMHDLRTGVLNSNARREALGQALDKSQLSNASSTLRMGTGDMNMGQHLIKNPDYYTQLLNSYNKYQLSPSNKKFYADIIASVKRNNGIATQRQLNELQRLRTGDFNFGKKGY